MYLAEIKMDFGEFDMMLFLFLKLEKKSGQNMEKEQRFWIRKLFEKHLFVYIFFKIFVKIPFPFPFC